jgi:hypothetical protein
MRMRRKLGLEIERVGLGHAVVVRKGLQCRGA